LMSSVNIDADESQHSSLYGDSHKFIISINESKFVLSKFDAFLLSR
jgi:hypothetical protein